MLFVPEDQVCGVPAAMAREAVRIVESVQFCGAGVLARQLSRGTGFESSRGARRGVHGCQRDVVQVLQQVANIVDGHEAGLSGEVVSSLHLEVGRRDWDGVVVLPRLDQPGKLLGSPSDVRP